MRDDLVTALVPVLGRSLDTGFNVFDVMHHGLHEKQISNVFRWLLESEGTHGFGDRFVRIFIDEVNRSLVGREPLRDGGYWVRQEVNTSVVGDRADIADLVLENRDAVLVVENYFISDGHGHSYERYLTYAERDGRRGVVVLLCRDEDRSLQTLGWQDAAVVTYWRLVEQLHVELAADPTFQRQNPEAYSFVDQMHRKFVTGRGAVDDHDVLGFVIAMCDTGEARRYQERSQDAAAERFASDLAEQARERFGEGRELLQRVKARLKGFSAGALASQLNSTLGDGYVAKVSAGYAGIYQWTINFDLPGPPVDFGEARLQLKFGPSAWFANERDPNWTTTVGAGHVDYSRLLLTRAETREVRQSVVTLQEVLDGLEPTDRRLHDEIVTLLSDQ